MESAYDFLYRRILEILPEATMGQDNDGQLIIYTNLKLDSNDNLLPFEDDADDSNK